jgi:lipopolysaccharide transport system ATP-binding protein
VAGADVLVHVDHASKKFCRDLKRSLWYGLKDTVGDLVGRSTTDTLRAGEFWAVDGVMLELRRGECLGLVGRNGAGKTTLLKMLNGVIKPDRGRIELRGRVGALIALGAGFNPILTGRENIFVNGAVLGLSRREITAELDGIIEFADIGDFIDSPVQSYSSGMQVRLGFAVATALRPDVLLLDEVLAVGDVAFRAKCYERLARIRDNAAFILVSHDSDQIARVCSSVLVLDRGRTAFAGDVAAGLRLYHDLALDTAPVTSHEHVSEDTAASLALCDSGVSLDGVFGFTLDVAVQSAVQVADLRVVLWDEKGLPAVDAYSRTQNWSTSLEPGRNRLACRIGPLRLRRGRYAVSIALIDRATNRHLYWGDRVRVVTAEGPVTGASAYTPPLECVLVSAAEPRL